VTDFLKINVFVSAKNKHKDKITEKAFGSSVYSSAGQISLLSLFGTTWLSTL
jgi:hypothetical protein